jgi:hypothetical protein
MRCLGGAVLSAALAASLALPASGATPKPVATETIDGLTGSTIPESDSTPPIIELGDQVSPGALPPVEYDVSKLPVPVQRLREQLMDAARTGNVERLRPIIEANPQLGARLQSDPDDPEISEPITDPVEYIRVQSGDPEGREILAILLEVLEAGYVHADIGTPHEMYIWPYFARYPLHGLTPEQTVELYKIVTSGDFEIMSTEAGGYSFYRVGITPSGAWEYFETGD